MADSKLADLTEATAPAASDLLYGVVDPGGTPADRKIQIANLGAVMKSLADAKGDLLVATADNTVARKAVGANGALLLADSGQTDGLRYALPDSAGVATGGGSEATTSTTYTDLTTAGPAVTATVGASNKVLVILSVLAWTSSAGQDAHMSIALSGAHTLAASDSQSAATGSTSGSALSVGYLLTGITAGSVTFTCKYRGSGGNTANFVKRRVLVIPL